MRFRVLLVDDEEEFVQTFSERLHGGWLSPEGAISMQHALRTVQSEVPGVMVLDLKLPGMNGMEVLRRAQRAYPEARVIILSGHGSFSCMHDKACLSGGFRYMEKPVDIDELIETLDRAYQEKMTDLVVAPTFSEAGQLSSAIFITEKD